MEVGRRRNLPKTKAEAELLTACVGSTTQRPRLKLRASDHRWLLFSRVRGVHVSGKGKVVKRRGKDDGYEEEGEWITWLNGGERLGGL